MVPQLDEKRNISEYRFLHMAWKSFRYVHGLASKFWVACDTLCGLNCDDETASTTLRLVSYRLLNQECETKSKSARPRLHTLKSRPSTSSPMSHFGLKTTSLGAADSGGLDVLNIKVIQTGSNNVHTIGCTLYLMYIHQHIRGITLYALYKFTT